MQEGLKPMGGNPPDICLAEHPYLCYAIFGDRATVLLVDITDLRIYWERGEGRCFEVIHPSRLEVMDPQPSEGHWSGWEDPGLRGNHSASYERTKELMTECR
jgi:hypothetical protein